MTRQPIVFRLTEHEYQLLEYAKQENESLNQCAARLLREKLGIKEEEGIKLDENTLDSYVVARVNSSVNGLKMWLEEYVNTLVHNKVNEKLAEAKPRSTPRKTPSKSAIEKPEI